MTLTSGPGNDVDQHDGVDRHALYTDTWARRDGHWTCIAANVTAAGV